MGEAFFRIASLRHLRESMFLKHVAKLVTGSVASQLVALGFAPILARLYSPKQFGLLGLFISFVTILSIPSTLGYHAAIVPTRTMEEAGTHLRMCVVLIALYSLVLFCCTMLIGSVTVARIFNVGNLGMWFLLVPIGVCLSGLIKAFSSYQSRQNGFGTIALATSAQSAGTAVSQTALFFIPGLGVGGLIIGNLLGSLASALINSAKIFYHAILFQLNSLSTWAQIWHCAKQSRDYPRYYLWADLLCSGAEWLPVIFISAKFNAAAAGAFFLGRRMIRIPLALLSSNVGKVVYQRASQFFFEKPNEMTRLILRTWGSLFVLGLLPATFLFITAEHIFVFIFGEPWRQAGQFVVILSPLFLAQFSVGPFGYIFNTVGKQRTYLLWEGTRFSAVLYVFLVIASKADLLTTIKWYSALMTSLYGLKFILLLNSIATGAVERPTS